MKNKRDKIICESCGKKFPNTKKNYSTFCKSCRGRGLKEVAEMSLRNEVKQ